MDRKRKKPSSDLSSSSSKRISADRKDSKADVKPHKVGSAAGSHRVVAMDCEMVGVGPDGERSALARVSIIDYHGTVLYDKYALIWIVP